MAVLETAHSDSTLCIVTTRNIQVNIWSNAPTVVQVRAFGRASATITRRHLRGAGLINLIKSGKATFSEEVREELVKLMKTSVFLLGASHVVVVGGLTGTAVRAFMSTVILLGRPAVPNKVFSEPKAAAAWHVPLLAQGAEPWSAAEFVALLEQAQLS